MFQKLEAVENRYEELNKKIADPEVIANTSEWTKFMKEHAEIEEVALKYKEYKQVQQSIEEAQEMLNDPEMRELAEEELYENKEKLPKIEETINNNRIRIKGLEIEYNTIVPQLDEMVVLEEKREADKEKLAELREKESIINIAIENLMDAYEEMKTTITPKFTKNLSESIQKISSNKYNKVTINDENGMIIENNRGEYVEAIKLSTGTIDQLYLALRLSMIDELSKENLPIILDESFAYSDNNRLKNMLQYLTSDLNNHQTIIFTCTDREQKMLEEMNIPYNVVEL